MGTAPTNVTFSAWVISQMSRGCGLGPPKIWVEPSIVPVNGTHHALAWNIGTMCKMTSLSDSASESTMAWARQCT